MKTLTAALLAFVLFPSISNARLDDADRAALNAKKGNKTFCYSQDGMWFATPRSMTCETLGLNKSFRSVVKSRWSPTSSVGDLCEFSTKRASSHSVLKCDTDITGEEVAKIVMANPGLQKNEKLVKYVRQTFGVSIHAAVQTSSLMCQEGQVKTAKVSDKFIEAAIDSMAKSGKATAEVSFGIGSGGVAGGLKCSVEVAGSATADLQSVKNMSFTLITGEQIGRAGKVKAVSSVFSVAGTENYLALNCIGGSNNHSLNKEEMNAALASIGVSVGECEEQDADVGVDQSQGSVEFLGTEAIH